MPGIGDPTGRATERARRPDDDPLVVTFAAIDSTKAALVGGKAGGLGELTRAGLPVPPGFCITTRAYELAAGGIEPGPAPDDPAATADASGPAWTAARTRRNLLAAPMPAAVRTAVRRAYAELGDGGRPIPVAVRSSATAEDLPFASFAGQHDSHLNVIGIEALLDAVRHCWASLWADRAVAYRAANEIDHRTVRMAVVVQRMVDADVAGVLFTADPRTGRRRRAVIECGPGLGEAVVRGAVEPDHFVVDADTGEIVERRLGAKRLRVRSAPGGGIERIELPAGEKTACVTDERLRALAELGDRVEAHRGGPQDIEWAIDADGEPWLTQARPITTLFPLPPGAGGDDLRVYACWSLSQGLIRPITPMGIALFRVMYSTAAGLVGRPVADRLVGPAIVVEIAHRLFVDMTTAVRSKAGRKMILQVVEELDAQSAEVFWRLFDDPRLAIRHSSAGPFLRVLAGTAIRLRLPVEIPRALLRATALQVRIAAMREDLAATTALPEHASPADRLTAVEEALAGLGRLIVRRTAPGVAVASGLRNLARTLLGDDVTDDELQVAMRALPYNVTTEMTLNLWRLTTRIRSDEAAARLLRETPAEDLARMYVTGELPRVVQDGMTGFLDRWGQRAVGEIDVGLARWSEDPAHVFGVIVNYLRLEDLSLAPDAQISRRRCEAESMIAELARRARRRGRLRARLVLFCLRRARELAGLQETQKYYLVMLFGLARRLLLPVGAELVRVGRLRTAGDIFFMDLREAREALDGRDLRAVVDARHLSYDRELRRRHVPLILRSDGSEPRAELPARAAGDGTFAGFPASAGIATAPVRVVTDPVGARLEPGEILVARSTDPGWTPLFLTAGGLVTELDSAGSHGAVLAREYGIPMVVGVSRATERLTSGQVVTVDGSAGTVAPA